MNGVAGRTLRLGKVVSLNVGSWIMVTRANYTAVTLRAPALRRRGGRKWEGLRAGRGLDFPVSAVYSTQYCVCTSSSWRPA